MPNEIFMPKLSSTMAEGTVIEWFKEEGDTIEVGEPILEIMTDKINIEVESYHDGILLKKYFEADDEVPVNHVIGYIGQKDEEVPNEAPGESKEAGQDDDTDTSKEESAGELKEEKVEDKKRNNVVSGKRESMLGKVRATPAARALARKKDIEINDVAGSGRNGRIHKEDVVNHQSDTAHESPDAPPISSMSKSKVEKLKGSRKVTAERMADSSATIPHVTIDFEVEMDSLIDLRTHLNDNNEDIKISFNDLFILITSKALKKHPDINITFENNEIHYHEAKNIGLAVAVDTELFVPVIKNTESKSLMTISQESKAMIQDTRNRQLGQDSMSEGTFTITNLGMYRIKQFTPIINKPQAAILGIGGTTEVPAIRDGKLHNKKGAVLSLSFDHRVINGAPAADFCDTVKRLAENPVELIL